MKMAQSRFQLGVDGMTYLYERTDEDGEKTFSVEGYDSQDRPFRFNFSDEAWARKVYLAIIDG
jgi:hypothetical protein